MLDVGTVNGQDFINQRSCAHSWEAASGSENDGSGGIQSLQWIFTGQGEGVNDFGAFTKRKHISPFLFRTTDDNYLSWVSTNLQAMVWRTDAE